MSETPTLPVSDERTAQVLTNTEAIYNSGDVDRHFARWEQGFSTHEHAERWDLNEPIVAFDPERTSVENTSYATPPEAAKVAETYEQQLEKSLHYRNTLELVSYSRSITNAVVAMRRAAYEAITHEGSTSKNTFTTHRIAGR